MHLNELIVHISQINFAVYICQRKNLLEVKARKIKDKINLCPWRRILYSSRRPETNPVFFPYTAYAFFLNPQQLVLWNLGHLVNISPNRPFFSVSGLSCPTCTLGNDASSPKSVLFICPFSIHHGSGSCSFSHFFPPQRVSVTSPKLQSFFSLQGCLHLSH